MLAACMALAVLVFGAQNAKAAQPHRSVDLCLDKAFVLIVGHLSNSARWESVALPQLSLSESSAGLDSHSRTQIGR